MNMQMCAMRDDLWTQAILGDDWLTNIAGDSSVNTDEIEHKCQRTLFYKTLAAAATDGGMMRPISDELGLCVFADISSAAFRALLPDTHKLIAENTSIDARLREHAKFAYLLSVCCERAVQVRNKHSSAIST
jgi:hypothetical protein